ncbi:MAG: ABC transporter related protein [Parcubacteria group bacterium GW2011_GWE2_39_37]|uniref:ABC transporter related protein n=1 Tax=Candidatus Falkowbacteria bacterium GW2011_GWF2_39_8 TaxID=1618642 RepID=A0A0G0PZ64_9BACT|nr:MAG: ABC transporter related protein [Parcubacteria group bacterium GW2011_GWE2_39_37]KKR33218.1 MAG: ABC transporter related protein [Candidatus Falkowbacteria bacterium GW2011_GWF2_39_8]
MQKVDHTKNIIEVKNVSFAYEKVDVLKNITLDIHKGDYVGIIGPNGAGKTTLFKVMLGLLKPREGSVSLFGQDLAYFKDWHKIGYVPQKSTNFDSNFPATVRDVVLMARYVPGKIFQKASKEDELAAEKALRQVNMIEYADRMISDLSGGQQQRIFIARALVNEPEIIFLDEPTSGIDKTSQDNFYKILQNLNKELGLTLVLISHDIERITEEVMHIACVDTTLTCHTSPTEYLKESGYAEIMGQKVKIITHHHHN